MALSRPLTDRHEICTQVWCGSSLKAYFRKIFYPTPKNYIRKNAYFVQKHKNFSATMASTYSTYRLESVASLKLLGTENIPELECGPMPNVMVALPNIGGALCSTPQSLADAHY